MPLAPEGNEYSSLPTSPHRPQDREYIQTRATRQKTTAGVRDRSAHKSEPHSTLKSTPAALSELPKKKRRKRNTPTEGKASALEESLLPPVKKSHPSIHPSIYCTSSLLKAVESAIPHNKTHYNMIVLKPPKTLTYPPTPLRQGPRTKRLRLRDSSRTSTRGRWQVARTSGSQTPTPARATDKPSQATSTPRQ